MSTQQPHQVDILNKYLNLFIGRHKLMVVCLLLAVCMGLLYYAMLPDIYQSYSSIIYQEKNINPSKLSPDAQMKFREMVNTVTQQVLSRKNLEDVIKRFDLYPEMRSSLPIEDVIEDMREKAIEISMGREKGNVFSVSYKGGDPRKVRKTTNALAAKFIEENLQMREERAKERARYIQDELRMSQEKLHKKEAQMRDYKLKYYNEMPAQREANMNRLNALQEQLQSIRDNIHHLEQTRLLVSEQLELRKNRRIEASASDSSGSEAPITGLRARLAEARSKRDALLTRYTSEHPRVKRIEKQISMLESELSGPADQAEGAENSYESAMDSRIQELSLQLREIDLDLRNLREERKNIRSRIETYQQWIEAAPVREAEWAALTRDYQELKSYHDELVSQGLVADATASLERRQQGSRFKILDPAFLPRTPNKGSFLKVLLASIALGLAAGSGIVVGLDFMDVSFKDRKEIEEYLGFPVTCVLPLVVTDSEKKRGKLKDILWYFFFVVWLLAIAGATVYLKQRGVIIF